MYASHKPTIGRLMLMTDVREITEENIISVVSKAFAEHQKNVADEIFLFEYEKGRQPILDREKKIRPELNATVVENKASEIVDSGVRFTRYIPDLVWRGRSGRYLGVAGQDGCLS